MRKLLPICAAAGISCGGAAMTTEFSTLCIGARAAF
jgi:hypothetical protein